jgi:hypothetical protein
LGRSEEDDIIQKTNYCKKAVPEFGAAFFNEILKNAIITEILI